jgi:hypothetical protein
LASAGGWQRIIACCAANVLISLREMTILGHLAERDEYIGRAGINKLDTQARAGGR